MYTCTNPASVNIKTRQLVAIKVLNLDLFDVDVKDIQQEIILLSKLAAADVQNITKYHGSYLHGSKLWIIMDYCSGGSISALLKAGTIEEKYSAVIMRELLKALVYIHREGIIHRDIKAANVLVTEEGQVQLCDFGVAAELPAAQARRMSVIGTPYWMAPEVIQGIHGYNTKADVWSLGVTLYEITTGSPPFSEQEVGRAIQLIQRSKPARLDGTNYSQPLKQFVAKCLDEQPEERATAEELSKTKFIKSARHSPTHILRDLIIRYTQWRAKNSGVRDSFLLPGGRGATMQSVGVVDDDDDTDPWDFSEDDLTIHEKHKIRQPSYTDFQGTVGKQTTRLDTYRQSDTLTATHTFRPGFSMCQSTEEPSTRESSPAIEEHPLMELFAAYEDPKSPSIPSIPQTQDFSSPLIPVDANPGIGITQSSYQMNPMLQSLNAAQRPQYSPKLEGLQVQPAIAQPYPLPTTSVGLNQPISQPHTPVNEIQIPSLEAMEAHVMNNVPGLPVGIPPAKLPQQVTSASVSDFPELHTTRYANTPSPGIISVRPLISAKNNLSQSSLPQEVISPSPPTTSTKGSDLSFNTVQERAQYKSPPNAPSRPNSLHASQGPRHLFLNESPSDSDDSAAEEYKKSPLSKKALSHYALNTIVNSEVSPQTRNSLDLVQNGLFSKAPKSSPSTISRGGFTPKASPSSLKEDHPTSPSTISSNYFDSSLPHTPHTSISSSNTQKHLQQSDRDGQTSPAAGHVRSIASIKPVFPKKVYRASSLHSQTPSPTPSLTQSLIPECAPILQSQGGDSYHHQTASSPPTTSNTTASASTSASSENLKFPRFEQFHGHVLLDATPKDAAVAECDVLLAKFMDSLDAIERELETYL